MSDMTRKDAGTNAPKMFVTFEMDLSTMTVTVETNVDDIPTLMRITGQGMHIWADNVMRKRVDAIKQFPPRKLVIPGRTEPS